VDILSAFVSAGVSALVANRVAGLRIRHEHAVHRDIEGREELRDLTEHLINEVNKYQRMSPHGARRNKGPYPADDIATVRPFLDAAKKLDGRLGDRIRQALTRIFGPQLMSLAGQFDSTDTATMFALVADTAEVSRPYLYHDAYEGPPNGPAIYELERELTKLRELLG